MRARTWLLAASLSMAVPAPALAQAPDVRSAGDALFHQAREAMTSRDWKRALELLRQSQTVDPGRGKLLNIAICEEELGRVASALAHFVEVAPQFAGDPRAATVKEHIDRITPRVPRIRIQLAPGAPPGATVTLDGAPVEAFRLGREMPVDPGEHAIKAVAPGARDRTYDLLVGEGARSVFTVAPDRLDAPLPAAPLVTAPVAPVPGANPAVPPPSPPPSSGRVPVWAWVSGGVGVVALGVAGGFGVAGLKANSSVKDQCGGDAAHCPVHLAPAASSLADQRTTDRNLFIGLGVVAVVGIGAAVIGIARAPSAASARASFTVAPYGAPSGGGLAMTGRF